MSKKSFESLLSAVEKAKQGNSYSNSNDNFWFAEQDKAGNAFAVIRFLPASSDDGLPFVKVYNHGFKNSQGKWFIENCPTSIGKDCPVCANNGTLWNSGIEKDKDVVRERKRKLSYISNVLVLKDAKNPENEGKVMLFKYGQKIFDKIYEAMKPTIAEGEDPIAPVNVFDLDDGANFKLKIRRVEGYANFDKSDFEAISKVDNQDKILSELHDINKFIDESNFKSFSDIEKKLNQVLGLEVAAKTPAKAPEEPKFESAPKSENIPDDVPSGDVGVDSDDDDMDYFRKLAGE